MNIKDEMAALNLGGQIRFLRNQRGLTLQEVSNITGISKPHLSQIENEVVSPPLATLIKISSALGVKIGYFFQESPSEKRIVVVRKRERDGIQQGAKLKEFASIGYRYEPLAYPMVNKYMEPFIIKVEPQSEEELTFNTHRGEEFVYLMEGNLEFRCADQIVELYEGDSLYFDSGLPHAYRGIDGEAVFLVVIFSPN